jgi:hypothetical protein
MIPRNLCQKAQDFILDAIIDWETTALAKEQHDEPCGRLCSTNGCDHSWNVNRWLHEWWRAKEMDSTKKELEQGGSK